MKRTLSPPRNENFNEEPRKFTKVKTFATKLGLNFIDDSIPTIPLFDLSPQERKYILDHNVNPLGYPQDYFNIYSNEIQLRKPNNYDHCIDITNQKVFIPGPEQQFAKQIHISQNTNINCIKSTLNTLNIDNIQLSQHSLDAISKNYNITLPMTKDNFYNQIFPDLNSIVNCVILEHFQKIQ